MNNLSKLLSLFIFMLVFSAQANENLWNALNAKAKDKAETIMRCDLSVVVTYTKDGKSVLDLIDELGWLDLIDVHEKAKRKSKMEEERGQRVIQYVRPVVMPGSFGGVLLDGARIREERGVDEECVPFHNVAVEPRRGLAAVAPRTVPLRTSARSSAHVEVQRDWAAEGFELPGSVLLDVPGAINSETTTTYGNSNDSQEAAVEEELQLTTRAVLFVLGPRSYCVKWITSDRAKEIDELVKQLLDPETLKQRLREKGLL